MIERTKVAIGVASAVERERIRNDGGINANGPP